MGLEELDDAAAVRSPAAALTALRGLAGKVERWTAAGSGSSSSCPEGLHDGEGMGLSGQVAHSEAGGGRLSSGFPQGWGVRRARPLPAALRAQDCCWQQTERFGSLLKLPVGASRLSPSTALGGRASVRAAGRAATRLFGHAWVSSAASGCSEITERLLSGTGSWF